LGDKQEELEATVHLENHNVVSVTESWWDDSHNWNGLWTDTICLEGKGEEGGEEELSSTLRRE